MNLLAPHRLVSYRPRVEVLEPRLPPGDALIGILIAWPELTPHFRDVDDVARSSMSLFDETEPQRVVSRSIPVNKATAEPTEHAPHLRAAGLIPAVYTAGISPAAREMNVHTRTGAMLTRPNHAPLVTDTTNHERPRPQIGMLSRPNLSIKNPFLPSRESTAPSPDSEGLRAEQRLGALPFFFEQNMGQADGPFDFVARGTGYSLGVSPTEAVFSLATLEGQRAEIGDVREVPPAANALGAPELVRMQIVGADGEARATGLDRLVTKTNYFFGNDPNQWHANVPTFAKVQYDEVYPGIDLVYYGQGRDLEYDFIVAPGADPSRIALSFSGADAANIDAAGNLNLHTGDTQIRHNAPYIYQELNGSLRKVTGSFQLSTSRSALDTGEGTHHSFLVTFEVGDYDTSEPLVIDPLILDFSTYVGVGKTNDIGIAMAMDLVGNYFVAGITDSSKFPVTPGAFDSTYNEGKWDAFVFKLSADGSNLIYGTYIGGSGDDEGLAISVDGFGNAYMAGTTDSPNFPITSGAFDVTHGGSFDSYVAKLTADGSALAYSTFLGGSGMDIPYDVKVDEPSNAYVIGESDSPAYPTTPGAFDTTHGGGVDAVVTKLSPDGASLEYSTFLGGSGNDFGFGMSLKAGETYIAGSSTSSDFPITPGAYDSTLDGIDADAYAAKLSADGSTLVSATYLGGSFDDNAMAIAVDGVGDLYLTGNTMSSDFPTTPGAFDHTYSNLDTDGFAAKLSADATNLVYGTYLGGNHFDVPQGIAVDGNGFAWVVGWSKSTDFPTTLDAFDVTANGSRDITLSKLSAEGGLVYSTYMGGSRSDGSRGRSIVLDAAGNINLAGWTDSSNFPITPGAYKGRNRQGIETYVCKFVDV